MAFVWEAKFSGVSHFPSETAGGPAEVKGQERGHGLGVEGGVEL